MNSVNYYHGGIPGLRVGERILPPSETGRPTLLEFAKADSPDGPQRADRVYVTTMLDDASTFAASYPHGSVYRVAPDSPLVPDPDACGGGYSYQTTGATVLSVFSRGSPRKAKLARRKLASMRKRGRV